MRIVTLLIVVLVLMLGYTCIQLTTARLEVRHSQAILTRTIETCGSAWLHAPVSDGEKAMLAEENRIIKGESK